MARGLSLTLAEKVIRHVESVLGSAAAALLSAEPRDPCSTSDRSISQRENTKHLPFLTLLGRVMRLFRHSVHSPAGAGGIAGDRR